MTTTERQQPLVSVCSIAYNQVQYIKECLDGIMMQQTDFKFELIIHDDASTDGTAEIIKEYANKYPEIIRPILQTENQYSKGKGILAPFVYPRAQGKYIALCEGDDYWTDPLKLQKQVDFLEANPDYSMCFHQALEKWDDCSKPMSTFSILQDKSYSSKDILRNWMIATASVCFRKNVIQSACYQEYSVNPNFIYGDIVLFQICVKLGKIYGMSDTMSVYRRHAGGAVFSESISRFYKQAIHYLELSKVFNLELRPIALKQLVRTSGMCIGYGLRTKNRSIVKKNWILLKSNIKFSELYVLHRLFRYILKGYKKYDTFVE